MCIRDRDLNNPLYNFTCVIDDYEMQISHVIRGEEQMCIRDSDRGVKFNKLTKEIKKKKIKNIILFPNTDKKIYKDLKNENINFFFTDNMKRAVLIAKQNTKKGNSCLLSPAAPSYNLFKNYKDRANQFKKYVKNEKLA